MKTHKQPFLFLVFIYLMAFCLPASAQVLIEFENPAAPSVLQVCDSASFEVRLTNNGTDTLRELELNITFPNGVTYNLGSVSNATELTTTNLSSPTFALDNLAPDGMRSIQLRATAQCELVDQINSGNLFSNAIAVNYQGGNNAITTSTYDIETPLLVIVNTNNLDLSGSRGQSLQRNITIRNTRFGSLSSFTFKDVFEEGLSITANPGVDISSSATGIELVLDGDDFRNIGDGDEFFELNESIVISEDILIEGCGFDKDAIVSDLILCWGCNGEICQSTIPVEAVVDIRPSQLTPELTFVPTINAPVCFCPAGNARQEMQITNNGNEAATNILLTLRQETVIGGYAEGAFFMDSSSVIVPLEVIFQLPLDFTCGGQGGLSRVARVSIPELAVGQTVTVFWTDYFCVKECSKAVYNRWSYDFSYFRSCPPDQFIEETGFQMELGIPFNNYLFSLQPVDTLTNLFQYTLASPLLTQSTGTMTVVFEIPCISTWSPSNTIPFNGQTPLNVTMTSNDSVAFYTATYSLPLSADSVSTDFTLEFDCLAGCDSTLCNIGASTSCEDACSITGLTLPGLDIKTTIDIDPTCAAGCGPQLCARQQLNYPCQLPPCKDSIPGYANFDFEIYRLNVGLPDNDDDQFLDAGGSVDLSKIRRDRMIPGDTIRSSLNAIVRTEEEDFTFRNAELSMRVVVVNEFDSVLNAALFSKAGWTPIAQKLRIYDQSSNQYFECDDPALSYQPDLESKLLTISTIVNAGSLAGTNCELPSDFEFARGDSICLLVDFKMNHNLVKRDTTEATPDILMIGVEPDVFMYNTGTEFYRDFSCDCFNPLLEYSGYCYSIAPGIYPVPPCDPSSYTSGNFFRILLGEPNFFPFEFRSLADISRFELEIPPEFSVTEARMIYLQLQSQINIFLNQALTPELNNGQWGFGIESLITEPLDEGFTLLLQYKFETACEQRGNFPISTNVDIDFAPGLPETANPLEAQGINLLGLRTLVPTMRFNAPLLNSTSFDDVGRWEFELINNPARVASTVSGPLYNCWVSAESPTGRVENFRLINQNTGSLITAVNGVFQLGEIDARDTLKLELLADNLSCSLEDVLLTYGWNCDPYLSRISPACFEQTRGLTVLSPPAELEQLVTSPVGPFELCDTIDYHVVEFFNADLGRAYEVLVEAQIPQGMFILPQSSQLSYPAGAIYEDIDDPLDLGGGLLQWNISQANDSIGQNGLPGSNLEPLNKARLRFKLTTDCDFISGSEVVAVVKANQNCALPANTLAESGESLEISGAAEPYSTNISIAPLTEVTCDDRLSLELNVTASAITSAADSLILSLPPRVSYVPGSFTGISNAPAEEPVLSTLGSFQQLRWRLPSGVAVGNQIRFSIEVEGVQDLPCGQQIMRIQTVAPDNARCALDGQTCAILVETGNLLFGFQIDRPVLEAINFTANATASGNGYLLDYEITVNNNGVNTDQPTFVDIYLDLDGDGRFSVGDQLIANDSIVGSILENTNAVLNGQIFINDADQLCALIAVIDPAKHCACQTAGATINNPITLIRPDRAAVCSDEVVTIGIDSVAGTLYQWNPTTNLTCPTCPTTTFELSNTGDSPQSLTYVLSEQTSSGCIINNEIRVIVQPEPGIVNTSDNLCLGASIELTATPAVSYVWSGPGITNPNAPTQTVEPTSDALYIVMLTDSAGCTGLDSILVTVTPIPGVDAGKDTSICENSVAQLGAVVVDGYTYEWSPANFLSNPTIPDPIILQSTSTTFYLTVTDDQGCQAVDSVRVNFSSPPILSSPVIDPVCAGERVRIELSGASSYVWTPETGLDCTDCAVVEAILSETTTYTVVGTDSEGCSSSIEVLVPVVVGSNTTAITDACEGEVIRIFGEEVTESGFYCDTLQSLQTGCDSIHCITLTINPKAETSSEAMLCRGDTLFFAGIAYTESGFYCGDFITAEGCDSTHCLTVELLENPVVTFEETVNGFRGTDIQLNLPAGFNYQWMPDTYLSCSDCADPIASIPAEETRSELIYEILILDDNGCRNLARLRILLADPICEEPNIFVPNAFTPNGDSENDFFEVFGAAIERMHLIVYNRWGQKVWESRDPSDQWDGTFNGQDLGTQSFGYYLEVDCVGGDRFLKKGNVTLLR